MQHQSAYEDGDQTALHTPASGSVWTGLSFFSSPSFLSSLFSLPLFLSHSLSLSFFSPLFCARGARFHAVPVRLSFAHSFHDGGMEACSAKVSNPKVSPGRPNTTMGYVSLFTNPLSPPGGWSQFTSNSRELTWEFWLNMLKGPLCK